MPERGRDYKTTPVSSIFYLSQIRVEVNIPWCMIFLYATGLYRLFNDVLLIYSILSQVSHCCQQSSSTIILWKKLWQRNRINMIALSDIARKLLTFHRICCSNFSSFLNSLTFFKCFKATTEKYAFPTEKNSWRLFLFLLCQIKILHISEYVIEN